MNWAKIIALLVFGSVNLWTQNAPPPQTARQALIEMFFGKSPKGAMEILPTADRNLNFKTFATENTECHRGKLSRA